ncbi:hypothetical protein GCM10018787_48790 [Streptomyces thermodiastaticus]|nr:hypothetical protein GCM10018787_48790 [Streptomyces thermodiastaticus]
MPWSGEAAGEPEGEVSCGAGADCGAVPGTCMGVVLPLFELMPGIAGPCPMVRHRRRARQIASNRPPGGAVIRKKCVAARFRPGILRTRRAGRRRGSFAGGKARRMI